MQTVQAVSVTVTETTTYRFPEYPDTRCSAHGQALCVLCARNPSTCAADADGNEPENAGCSCYSVSGMHWDTCPNRIR